MSDRRIIDISEFYTGRAIDWCRGARDAPDDESRAYCLAWVIHYRNKAREHRALRIKMRDVGSER